MSLAVNARYSLAIASASQLSGIYLTAAASATSGAQALIAGGFRPQLSSGDFVPIARLRTNGSQSCVEDFALGTDGSVVKQSEGDACDYGTW